MRYLIVIKRNNKFVHEFFADSDQEALTIARQYLKGWGVNFKKYSLVCAGI